MQPQNGFYSTHMDIIPFWMKIQIHTKELMTSPPLMKNSNGWDKACGKLKSEYIVKFSTKFYEFDIEWV